MIAIIVCGIFIIISTLFAIEGIVKRDENEFVALPIIVAIVSIIALSISLGWGNKSITTLEEKEQIECLLENHLNYDTIHRAKVYNDNVEFGNNYWCRFNIEDRSEYKIDIDKYIAREGEK